MPLASEVNDKINLVMRTLVPELDSECAAYPLRRPRWLRPDERYEPWGRERQPCFVASDTDEGIRPNYIYRPATPRRHGRGQDDLPAGYYHLRTREGHEEAYRRFRDANPHKRGFGNILNRRKVAAESSSASDQLKASIPAKGYRQVRHILHNRILYEPDDVQSSRMRLLNVQSEGGTAKAAGKAAYLPALTTALLIGF